MKLNRKKQVKKELFNGKLRGNKENTRKENKNTGKENITNNEFF